MVVDEDFGKEEGSLPLMADDWHGCWVGGRDFGTGSRYWLSLWRPHCFLRPPAPVGGEIVESPWSGCETMMKKRCTMKNEGEESEDGDTCEKVRIRRLHVGISRKQNSDSTMRARTAGGLKFWEDVWNENTRQWWETRRKLTVSVGFP